jgi:SAM-dependent methyltransferase
MGSGTGNLLAALKPSVGVGVDFSEAMIERARRAHPQICFVHADAHEFESDQQFDFVILSDLIHDVWDLEQVLRRLLRVCTPRTRVILNSYSRLWEPPLAVAARLGWARPVLQQDWFTAKDTANLLAIAGFEVLRHWPEILLPLGVPLLDSLANRYLVKLWPIKHLALTNFVIACPVGAPAVGVPRSRSSSRRVTNAETSRTSLDAHRSSARRPS